MKYQHWQIGSPQPVGETALEQAGIPALLAKILAARGMDCPEKADAFLRSVNAPLPDPMLLSDMAAARDRVLLALERREPICVFGDYDVDGITATCLLTDYLRSRGTSVESYIPDRLDEGYGLTEKAIRNIYSRGIRLLITVDCGITAVEEAQLCRALGMDLIVTDHHTCGSTLPEALAVIDPYRPDDRYPFRGLAGVGVAFKLAAAVEGNQQALLQRYCDLLTLGTVADVMPLLEENRAIVARGVKALQDHPRLGIRALAEASGTVRINTGTIGYTLAPRINAAGRMGRASLALELLEADTLTHAQELAEALCVLNRERQTVEQTIYSAAKKQLAGLSFHSIVLASADWHQGVVGIVASRLSEEYHCPACLICLDGETGRASCRSYGGFPLMDAFQQLAPLLVRYGGHQQAAGFTIREDQIDSFRVELERMVSIYQAAAEMEPALRLDCTVDHPDLLSLEQVEALEALEPCGADCPQPQICVPGLTVLQAVEVGGGRHLRLRLQFGNLILNGIYFSMTALRAAIAPGDVIDVAAIPQINEFRGLRSVQLQLIDLRLTEEQRLRQESERLLYERQRSGGPLSAAEAASLLPPRAEFAAVWRYLKAGSQAGQLREEPDCLSRKIARSTGLPLSFMRTRICLDVFQECGLLRLTRQQEQYEIRLTDDGRRADLNASAILAALREAMGEK